MANSCVGNRAGPIEEAWETYATQGNYISQENGVLGMLGEFELVNIIIQVNDGRLCNYMLEGLELTKF